jgi:hypothetical protein
LDKTFEFTMDFQGFNPMLVHNWTTFLNLLWIFKVLTECRTRIGQDFGIYYGFSKFQPNVGRESDTTLEFTTDFQSFNPMSGENWTKLWNLL